MDNNINLFEIINSILNKKVKINTKCDFNLNDLGLNMNKYDAINNNLINNNVINKDNIYHIIFDYIYNRNDVNYDNIICNIENDINNNKYKINKQYIFNKNINIKYVFKNIKINNIKDNVIDDVILLFICYNHNININIIKDNIIYVYYIDEYYDKNKKELIITINEKNYVAKNKLEDILSNYKDKKIINIYNLIGMSNELKIVKDKYLISPIIKKNKTIKYIDFCSMYNIQY